MQYVDLVMISYRIVIRPQTQPDLIMPISGQRLHVTKESHMVSTKRGRHHMVSRKRGRHHMVSRKRGHLIGTPGTAPLPAGQTSQTSLTYHSPRCSPPHPQTPKKHPLAGSKAVFQARAPTQSGCTQLHEHLAKRWMQKMRDRAALLKGVQR
jgi:hypothetical protein